LVFIPFFQNADGNFPPSDLLGFSYSDALKKGKARISVDFNLKSFETLAGIPYMSTSNSILVHKAVKEKEIAVSIFGPTFGLKGSTTSVQGRHEAIRVLTQLSTVEMVGKYLALPYWRLYDESAEEDKIVLMKISSSYYAMNDFDRLVNMQQWLYLHKYNIDISGEMDAKTKKALAQFANLAEGESPKISLDIFKRLYLTIPLDEETFARRVYLNKLMANI